MKIQKGDYVLMNFHWTRRLKTDKAYKVIDIYPIFVMNLTSPSIIENYLMIEDEEHIITGYSESKFTISPNNQKLKRSDKLKKLDETRR